MVPRHHYTVAAEVLGMVGIAYVLREAINVARRYLVENSCTRINRDMSFGWSIT